MDTPPLHSEARTIPSWSVSSQDPLKRQPEAICTSLTLTEIHEVTDDDFELIEMRYQQMLALMNLEGLFAEGQLDCM